MNQSEENKNQNRQIIYVPPGHGIIDGRDLIPEDGEEIKPIEAGDVDGNKSATGSIDTTSMLMIAGAILVVILIIKK
jgi:hypothetical protein